MYVNSVEGLDALRNILPYLDKGFRYAVEVRHRSWFQDLAYNFFVNNNMCLVWNQLADIRTPPIVTSDFVYVRLIGDRSIQERDFGRIQIDRIKEMKKVARNFKNLKRVICLESDFQLLLQITTMQDLVLVQ
jgi:uncharacterized protein YecE (DUF72 family)